MSKWRSEPAAVSRVTEAGTLQGRCNKRCAALTCTVRSPSGSTTKAVARLNVPAINRVESMVEKNLIFAQELLGPGCFNCDLILR